MRRIACLLVIVVGGGACGGDDPKPPAAAQQTAAAPLAPPPGAGSGSGKPLPVFRKIESQIPDADCNRRKPPPKDAKKCDPAALKTVVIAGDPVDPATDKTCPERFYCLPTSEGYLCGPCPERDTIRHVFKDTDFSPDTNRDPFQSYLIKPDGAGSGSGDLPRDPTSRCKPNEPIRVATRGFRELKLVGIVAQGTQRKVLMLDPGTNYGHIIRRGDCVGKEKAFVKEIGENFICFELTQEQTAASGTQEGLCFELHTKQTPITELPSDAPVAPRPTTITPIIPPPPTLPATRAGSGSGSAAPPLQPPPVLPPPQTPTNLKP